MEQVLHILNGDALADQLPDTVGGKRLIMREAMIEGPVHTYDSPDFLQQRGHYFEAQYTMPAGSYNADMRPQLEAIARLPGHTEVNLWFEQDLFCQTNLWYCCHLLQAQTLSGPVYLVLAPAHSPYSFGALQPADLPSLLEQRQVLSSAQLVFFAQLWEAYATQQLAALKSLAQQAPDRLSFVRAAVAAQVDRYPAEGGPGRPERALLQIINQDSPASFGRVFQAFCKQEAVYGFGDLQVKKMYDALLKA